MSLLTVTLFFTCQIRKEYVDFFAVDIFSDWYLKPETALVCSILEKKYGKTAFLHTDLIHSKWIHFTIIKYFVIQAGLWELSYKSAKFAWAFL